MIEKPPQKPAPGPLDRIEAPAFDPFHDRLSRDIRNGLSRAFGQALAAGKLDPVEELGAAHLSGVLAPGHRDYVTGRLERYRRAFTPIRGAHGDPVRQGLILWDLRLFFEVHEVLEQAWHRAEGGRRRLLQALIRAAGVYIKLEFGQARQAAGLAEKACAGLEENRDALRAYFAPEELIAALRSLNPTPPLLMAESSGSLSVSSVAREDGTERASG
jgi:hypothetical protein